MIARLAPDSYDTDSQIPMSYSEEFLTVDLILDSEAETRGVDAFALSLIKAERQVRKLFTYLVYQFPVFGAPNIQSLKETLAANNRVYFEGLVAGFEIGRAS